MRPIPGTASPSSTPSRAAATARSSGRSARPPTIRSGDWLYVENADGFRELYDLSGGPCVAWQAGDAGDPCLLTNLLAGEADAEAVALGATLAAELAAKKVEVAPEPVLEARPGS